MPGHDSDVATKKTGRLLLLVAASILAICLAPLHARAQGTLRAGAATTNISPWLGLSINGNMTDVKTAHVHDELHARALVLDDGNSRLAIVVCDSCMIPREVVADARRRIL